MNKSTSLRRAAGGYRDEPSSGQAGGVPASNCLKRGGYQSDRSVPRVGSDRNGDTSELVSMAQSSFTNSSTGFHIFESPVDGEDSDKLVFGGFIPTAQLVESTLLKIKYPTLEFKYPRPNSGAQGASRRIRSRVSSVALLLCRSECAYYSSPHRR
jgi:hypothetical protein